MRKECLGGTIVTCDGTDSKKKCPAEFRTASARSVIGKQLAAAGWTEQKGIDGKVKDFCQFHSGPRSIMPDKRGY